MKPPRLPTPAAVAFDHAGTLAPAPGRPVATEAAHAVRALHRRGLRIVLASNTIPEEAPTRYRDLYHAGVIDCFAAVLASSEIGYAKPSWAFYTHVHVAAGCAREEILFVGDNPTCDVIGPLAAGMRATLVAPRRPPGLPRAVPVIASVANLPDLLPPDG